MKHYVFVVFSLEIVANSFRTVSFISVRAPNSLKSFFYFSISANFPVRVLLIDSLSSKTLYAISLACLESFSVGVYISKTTFLRASFLLSTSY